MQTDFVIQSEKIKQLENKIFSINAKDYLQGRSNKKNETSNYHPLSGKQCKLDDMIKMSQYNKNQTSTDNLLATPTKQRQETEADEAPQPRSYQMQPIALRSNLFSNEKQ